jgi:hypothetical protein
MEGGGGVLQVKTREILKNPNFIKNMRFSPLFGKFLAFFS